MRESDVISRVSRHLTAAEGRWAGGVVHRVMDRPGPAEPEKNRPPERFRGRFRFSSQELSQIEIHLELPPHDWG